MSPIPSRSRLSLRALLVATSMTLLSSNARPQAVQAIQNANEVSLPDNTRQAVARAVEQYRAALSAAGPNLTGNQAEARVALQALLDRGEELLAARGGEVAAAVERYRAAQAAFFATPGRSAVTQFANVPFVSAAQGLPVPGAGTLVPDIVFTVGPEFYTGASRSLTTIGISSNLLGAAGGAVFDALGSATLKDYFSKNVSVGTAFPTNGDNKKLSAQLGLGLGGINLKAVTIWPVLNFEQTDSADRRVPSALKQRSPTEQNWSSPIFSVAVVPFGKKSLEDRLRAGNIVPIPVIGVRLPYYYPGDVFGALAAVFTTKRADFANAGKPQFIIAVSIPLLKIQPSTTKAGSGSTTGTPTEDQKPPSN